MQALFTFFAIIKKELALLWRDKAGLLILFVMPMLLVLILTLLHPDESTAPTKITVLYKNLDKSSLGKAIKKGLKKSEHYVITDISKKRKFTLAKAEKEVLEGKYQALVIVPKGASYRIRNYVQRKLSRQATPRYRPKQIRVIVDPSMPGALKGGLTSTIEIIKHVFQVKVLAGAVSRLTRSKPVNFDSKLVTVKASYASDEGEEIKANTVQQYVPAWTLFGMFLIIIPLSSVLIKERELGILMRLYAAPVSKFSYLLARIVAFAAINLVQLALMFSVGVFIMPLFDFPSLNLGGHMGLVTLTGMVVALSATGFGVLVGIWAKTYEQATALGPILIVIAAAIGGIFAPTYLLPPVLQNISHFSPMYWAQSAFTDIIVRNSSVTQIAPDLLKLFCFFLVSLLLSTWRAMRRI